MVKISESQMIRGKNMMEERQSYASSSSARDANMNSHREGISIRSTQSILITQRMKGI
jgi:hypothetical protein